MHKKNSPAANTLRGEIFSKAKSETIVSTVYSDLPLVVADLESVAWGRITHRFLLRVGDDIAIECVVAESRAGETFIAPKSTRGPRGFECSTSFSREFAARVLAEVETQLAALMDAARVA